MKARLNSTAIPHDLEPDVPAWTEVTLTLDDGREIETGCYVGTLPGWENNDNSLRNSDGRGSWDGDDDTIHTNDSEWDLRTDLQRDEGLTEAEADEAAVEITFAASDLAERCAALQAAWQWLEGHGIDRNMGRGQGFRVQWDDDTPLPWADDVDTTIYIHDCPEPVGDMVVSLRPMSSPKLEVTWHNCVAAAAEYHEWGVAENEIPDPAEPGDDNDTLIEATDAAMRHADEAGENWADYVDGYISLCGEAEVDDEITGGNTHEIAVLTDGRYLYDSAGKIQIGSGYTESLR